MKIDRRLHYLHNNVLVIDQSEYIEDRPVPGPFTAFPMTKREKPWERGCPNLTLKTFSYLLFNQFILSKTNFTYTT